MGDALSGDLHPRRRRAVAARHHILELAGYVEHWGQPDDLGLLAAETSMAQPVGAAWLRCFGEGNKGYGYIDAETPELSIALLPTHRGKGIGTALLSALLVTAQTRCRAVCLSVSLDNPAARLYQRLGFEVVSRDATSLIMRRWLRPNLPEKSG